MVFNYTFNNISNMSDVSWRSILLVKETGLPIDNHRQTFSHSVVSNTPHHEWDSNSQL